MQEMQLFSVDLSFEFKVPHDRVSPSANPTAGSSGVSSTPRLLDSIIRLWNTGSPAFAGDDGGEWRSQ
jgi:hypothetical protein